MALRWPDFRQCGTASRYQLVHHVWPRYLTTRAAQPRTVNQLWTPGPTKVSYLGCFMFMNPSYAMRNVAYPEGVLEPPAKEASISSQAASRQGHVLRTSLPCPLPMPYEVAVFVRLACIRGAGSLPIGVHDFRLFPASDYQYLLQPWPALTDDVHAAGARWHDRFESCTRC